MGERIEGIVWQENHRMEVVYVGRKPDRVVANEIVAKRLAEDAGLVLVSTAPGVVRWVRDPDSWSARAAEAIHA